MEPEHDKARAAMLEQQLKARGIRSPAVLAAMGRVARHRFLRGAEAAKAYGDHPLSIGLGQTISQPYMVACMTEMLDLGPEDRVLEVGTGSGYQAAVLAELAGEVVTVERHEALAKRARGVLEDLGYENVTVRVGDGTLGDAAAERYDAIVVTAGSPKVPPALPPQLAMGGRLVCPVGGIKVQELVMLRRTEAGFEEQRGTKCIFVPLIGRGGWPGEG